MQRHDHCLSCKRHLSAYIDGELSSYLMAKVEAHLAECSQCREEYTTQKKMWTSLTSFSAPEPDMRLETEVLLRIAMSKKHMAPQRWLPVPIGVAACGLFLGIFLASSVIKNQDALIISNDGIMQALDVFSPAPTGSFSNAYLSMLNDTGR